MAGAVRVSGGGPSPSCRLGDGEEPRCKTRSAPQTGGGNGKLARGSPLGKSVGRGGTEGPEDAGPGSYSGRPGRVTPRLRYRPRRKSRSHTYRRERTDTCVGGLGVGTVRDLGEAAKYPDRTRAGGRSPLRGIAYGVALLVRLSGLLKMQITVAPSGRTRCGPAPLFGLATRLWGSLTPATRNASPSRKPG